MNLLFILPKEVIGSHCAASFILHLIQVWQLWFKASQTAIATPVNANLLSSARSFRDHSNPLVFMFRPTNPDCMELLVFSVDIYLVYSLAFLRSSSNNCLCTPVLATLPCMLANATSFTKPTLVTVLFQ